MLITADGGYRRGQMLPLKQMADEALKETPSIRNVVVVKRDQGSTFPGARAGRPRPLVPPADAGRVAGHVEPEPMDSEDMLYILYTSGTTGKPKGIVHTTGGYMVGTYATSKLVFDLKETDVYWCTADIGWVTGHSYVVYGPLAAGATVFIYEGAPDWPEKDRFWSLIERHGVTVFYTAPTAIRAFMRWGTHWPAKHDLSSLRLLGSVGEPINPEAWIWYHLNIGRERCPIVDTWWQTETGQILITPLPGLVTTKPGSATLPFPGIFPEVRQQSGEPVEVGGGLLVLTKPWPAMLRGIYGDHERFVAQYFSRFADGVYFTGDGARRDADGYFWLLGRVDDVLNVAGHRIGTMEVESALVDHPMVAEAAVVGRHHEIKGQAIAAFVTLKEGREGSLEMAEELKEHVVQKIGAIARPEEILFTADLPKTRSGKIMRRLLRDIAEGKTLGDTTTLADPAVVARLKDKYEATRRREGRGRSWRDSPVPADEPPGLEGGRCGQSPSRLGVLAVGGWACRGASSPPDEAPRAQVEPAPLAVAQPRPGVAAGGLTVELVRVQRLEKDLVQAELLATNGGQAPVDLNHVLSSPVGGLAQAAFTHESGDVRTFVLRDDQDVPQCSTGLGTVAPGGQTAFFVRFAALSDGPYQGTIEIPGLPPSPASRSRRRWGRRPALSAGGAGGSWCLAAQNVLSGVAAPCTDGGEPASALARL